eukprot:m51a1_g2277 hypothetical protein (319) ;mRNA; r:377105-378351
MTKLIIETKRGHRFFVMKETTRRSDPSREDVERAMVRSRRYTPNALVNLQLAGALHEFVINGRRFAFVRTDAPTILGGRNDGFWKVFQRRYGYKHAVHGSDRFREPQLWDQLVQYFCAHVEEGSIAPAPRKDVLMAPSAEAAAAAAAPASAPAPAAPHTSTAEDGCVPVAITRGMSLATHPLLIAKPQAAAVGIAVPHASLPLAIPPLPMPLVDQQPAELVPAISSSPITLRERLENTPRALMSLQSYAVPAAPLFPSPAASPLPRPLGSVPVPPHVLSMPLTAMLDGNNRVLPPIPGLGLQSQSQGGFRPLASLGLL